MLVIGDAPSIVLQFFVQQTPLSNVKLDTIFSWKCT